MSGWRQPGRVSVRWAGLVVVSWFLVALPGVSHPYSSGPPDGYTGAPGQETCFTCHDNFPVNSGPGVFSVAAPEEFVAGETYEILVSLEQTGQSQWGFEFTPLDVGTCTITDAQNTQSSTSGADTYVKQTAQGSYGGSPGPASWTFEWTAPQDSPDEVVFYAAGNAANGNGATSGDYVYTAFAISMLAPAAANDGPTASPFPLRVSGSPNPIRESATLSYSLPARTQATLAIHDAQGRLVTNLSRGESPAGASQVTWECSDNIGRPVPAGLYVCRLTAIGRVATARLVVVR
jgi:hypothetical protein